jgi:hypothetical protein
MMGCLQCILHNQDCNTRVHTRHRIHFCRLQEAVRAYMYLYASVHASTEGHMPGAGTAGHESLRITPVPF